MKKIYEAPTLEIEIYRLDANIASNCSNKVNAGPAMPDAGYENACDGYTDVDEGIDWSNWSLRSDPLPTDFYTTEVCDCKYSSTGSGYFTS